MVGITTHNAIMNKQQLMKTIEDQNQVIIAKDKYIEELQQKLRKTSNELYGLRWEVSEKTFNKEWATEAMHQKAVKVIGDFQYNTRYISLESTIWILFAGMAITVFVMKCIR